MSGLDSFPVRPLILGVPQALYLCFELKSGYTLPASFPKPPLSRESFLGLREFGVKTKGENHKETSARLPCVGTGGVLCLNRLGTSSGSSSGEVLGKTGSPISSATVTASSAGTGISRSATRHKNSRFRRLLRVWLNQRHGEQPAAGAIRSQADVFAAWGEAQRLGQMDHR